MATYTPRPVKPDLPSYPPETLQTCEVLNRPSFEARFGEQPPPYTNEKPDKLWFDTSENAGNYMRLSRDAANKPSLVAMTMSKELAASVNIPGAYRWPKYVPTPTPAKQIITGTVLPFPAGFLASVDDARALAIELGGTFEIAPNAHRPPFDVDLAGDPRDVYQVVVGGQSHNAGQLLSQKYSGGVGAPGRWVTAKDGGLSWEITPQETAQIDPKVKPIPVPCRPLDADEEFYAGFGNVWVVRKKVAAPVASGLDDIARMLRLIMDRFGITG
jgi:hypothetical protein